MAKKFIYEINEPPGRLTFTATIRKPNTKVLSEIEAAYMAWHDLEDPCVCLPEYIVAYLNDADYIIKNWSCEYYD